MSKKSDQKKMREDFTVVFYRDLTKPMMVMCLVMFLAVKADCFREETRAQRTWTICAEGCDFDTIAKAEAASSAGDTLAIMDSRYYAERWTPTEEKTLLVGEGFSPSLQSGEWTITTEGLE